MTEATLVIGTTAGRKQIFLAEVGNALGNSSEVARDLATERSCIYGYDDIPCLRISPHRIEADDEKGLSGETSLPSELSEWMRYRNA